MNDDIRRQVYLSEVLNSHAYMLFYVRVNPRQQPPVVPPSHVAPPSSKKRCAPLNPLGSGQVEDGEIADSMDSVPLCKRAKYQQQQQHATAPAVVKRDPAFADAQNGFSHSADSAAHSAALGSSHAKTGILSQHHSVHADLNGNTSVGISNGDLSMRQSRHQGEEEGMGEGGGGVAVDANGGSFIGPPCRALPDMNRPPQTSATGDLLTYQHRPNTWQPSSAGNGAVWKASGAKPDRHAADSPTMADASSPSPAGSSPGAAAATPSLAGDSPKGFGFRGFSLASIKSLSKGRSPSKLNSAAASVSQPACMTPPSQRHESAPICLGQQVLHPAQRKHSPTTSPIKPLSFDDEPNARSGHKRSRAESFAETELKSEYDVELILEDEVPVAQVCKTHMGNPPDAFSEPPPDPSASSKQYTHRPSGTLPAGSHAKGQAESKASTNPLLVNTHAVHAEPCCSIQLCSNLP